MLTIEGKYSKAIVFTDNIDIIALEQLNKIVNHQTFNKPISIMPDVHAGASNAVIGFTMPLSDSIIPNTVGVDIGCGMIACKINRVIDNKELPEIDKKIRQIIPIGNHKGGVNKRTIIEFENNFNFEKANCILHLFTKKYNSLFGKSFSEIEYNFRWFELLCEKIDAEQQYIENSLCSLGGGNHFIEIGMDNKDNSVWLTVHTGSRQLGKLIAEFHSKIAKKICKTDVPKQMEFLTEKEMYNYFIDMIFAQVYASENRKFIIDRILNVLKTEKIDFVESIHNYIDFEDLIIRKGAISSYNGKRMIIPFNMADGIIICEGKSNEQWNFSAPHGAGRLLSRTKAFETLSLENYSSIMREKNIFTTSVSKATLDEAPMAYKPADEIEKAITNTAKILFKIKPIYNLKSS